MKVVSLFSGAGGLDLGLKQAGLDIIWANDLYKDAVETYKKNIGDHVVLGDISEIDSDLIPECDVVVGGFPCQGFSVANMNRKADDPRNKLYLEMVRVIKDKMPKFFIAENVKGILSLDKGKVIEKIKEDFESLGYDVQYHLFNCADYGVPQTRMRVIIFGQRRDLDLKIDFPPKPTHSKNDNSLLPWVTVGEALAKYPEPDEPNDLHNHVCSEYKLRFNGHLGHRTIDPNKPSPTITGRGDEKGGVVVLHHPNNHRRMTVRETATVQSFPDEFFFVGTKTSGYRQIANAVPPKLGFHIGKILTC
ncbi:DNA (cytosine-5-)-methyltransferase [Vibrio parahaemolyticus]|uniref:DNA cytosine methyltransferase n=1 Tax=Vibrio parahaemolyticus TaxID=670 RepID=UPI0011225556|nr:DNA cytosine methyltransferase [Vibrio parahaemolyticus]EGQ9248933.1 DNA cytosine methyltransferase [Vibrio parahaemolyticus]EJU9841277.1 DNA cytosine methyltransferase [Vibrio parahaemolyticus]EKO5219202.1 DNA cytosine methyltransferase [Vibrio parahaemolyticus]ELB2269325.1 DNA cytosine methyltransferase [Vibrio parahaemolyticus]MBM5079336.1 DNA cytosine methyltransferase [Vibrio parahaemolyticus]